MDWSSIPIGHRIGLIMAGFPVLVAFATALESGSIVPRPLAMTIVLGLYIAYVLNKYEGRPANVQAVVEPPQKTPPPPLPVQAPLRPSVVKIDLTKPEELGECCYTCADREFCHGPKHRDVAEHALEHCGEWQQHPTVGKKTVDLGDL